MPLRLSDRTSNSKALSTICRLLFRRVSFLAFRTRSSSMSMLVLMRRLYTILKHFCASRCASVSKLAPRVEAAAMLGRRARVGSRPIRMLVRFGQAVFKFGVFPWRNHRKAALARTPIIATSYSSPAPRLVDHPAAAIARPKDSMATASSPMMSMTVFSSVICSISWTLFVSLSSFRSPFTPSSNSGNWALE